MSTSLAFEIRDSAIAGKGAFAIRPIKKGERLIEYTGERISHPVLITFVILRGTRAVGSRNLDMHRRVTRCASRISL